MKRLFGVMTFIVLVTGFFSLSVVAESLDDLDGYLLWNGDQTQLSSTAIIADDATCGEKRLYEPVRFVRSYLLDAVVWLTRQDDTPLRSSNRSEPAQPAKILESSCEFLPRVSIVSLGGAIEVENKDEKPHWLIADIGSSQLAQQLQTADQGPLTLNASALGPIKLRSALHHWMKGYVQVVDSDYSALIEEDGQFHLKNIPEGTYILHAWHPVFGELLKEVSLPRHSRVELVYPDVIPAS